MPFNEPALFSSASTEWSTPQALFDALAEELGPFELDAAASPDNAKCERFFSVEDDALTKDWHVHRRVWLNPPYGRGISAWVQKSYEESLKGCRVVVLTMARTDTLWWQRWATRAAQIQFIRGRVWFLQGGEQVGPGTAPSAVLVFDEELRQPVVSHVALPRR